MVMAIEYTSACGSEGNGNRSSSDYIYIYIYIYIYSLTVLVRTQSSAHTGEWKQRINSARER
jgi:hypothetical protein